MIFSTPVTPRGVASHLFHEVKDVTTSIARKAVISVAFVTFLPAGVAAVMITRLLTGKLTTKESSADDASRTSDENGPS
jgi:hypothetical protein